MINFFELGEVMLPNLSMGFPSFPIKILPKFHFVSFQRTFFANDALVQRVTVGAVGVYFGVHREGHSVSGRTKFLDLFFGAGFLTTELIAGNPQTTNPLSLNFWCNSSKPLY